MSQPTSHLTAAFIDAQRAQLLALREELTQTTASADADESGLQDSSLGETHDSGGDAQKIALKDNDAAVVEHNRRRLVAVSRALAKIEDGSYGLSDESGDAIPQARLEAIPESLYTVEEEGARESVA